MSLKKGWEMSLRGKSMISDRFSMVTENIEGYEDFNIEKEWYKNRKKGLSALIRCHGDERWIGPCIESCLSLFDEIIVVIVGKNGEIVEEIIKSFNSSKIKAYSYPFELKQVKKPTYKTKIHQKIDLLSELTIPPKYKQGSVHTISYLTNWGLSKTKYSHVAPQWDADHILRPEFSTEEFKKFILSKNYIRVAGYNVVTDDYKFLSKKTPLHNHHPRFFKVDKFLYFIGTKYNLDILSYRSSKIQLKMIDNYFLFPIQQIKCMKNLLTKNDIIFNEPIYFHTKFLKSKEERFYDTRFLNEEYQRQFNECTEPGEILNIDVPDCAFKKPEDYINGEKIICNLEVIGSEPLVS